MAPLGTVEVALGEYRFLNFKKELEQKLDKAVGVYANGYDNGSLSDACSAVAELMQNARDAGISKDEIISISVKVWKSGDIELLLPVVLVPDEKIVTEAVEAAEQRKDSGEFGGALHLKANGNYGGVGLLIVDKLTQFDRKRRSIRKNLTPTFA